MLSKYVDSYRSLLLAYLFISQDVQPTVEAEDTYLEGHHEPLREPSPAPADPTDLEPIPVVDAAPPLVETAHPVSAAGEITPPIEHVDEENEDPTPISAATEEVHSSGKIPSAQVMLDAAVDENTEATDGTSDSSICQKFAHKNFLQKPRKLHDEHSFTAALQYNYTPNYPSSA